MNGQKVTPAIQGERTITTMTGCTVTFDDAESLITIYGKNDEEITLDPTDLSVIYGAYMQMLKERSLEESPK